MKVRYGVLAEAAKDYRYLLDRGYPQKAALNLVTSRYTLTSEERSALMRCVHRSVDAVSTASKLVSPIEVRGSSIVVDGYNTLLTILTALEGGPLFLCDDCVVRDVRSSYTKGITAESLVKSLEALTVTLISLQPSHAFIILDKNVSHSAEHASIIRRALLSRGISSAVELRQRADLGVLEHSAEVVSSSDYVILARAHRAFDLGGYAAARVVGAEIIMCFTSSFGEENLCGGPAGI